MELLPNTRVKVIYPGDDPIEGVIESSAGISDNDGLNRKVVGYYYWPADQHALHGPSARLHWVQVLGGTATIKPLN